MNTENNLQTCNINNLPDEILRKILLHLSGTWVCKNAILVSKKWHSVVDTESFWVSKGVCDKRTDKRVLDLAHNSKLFISKQLYFHRPFNRNLLKNGCGHDLLKYWCIMLTSNQLFDIDSLQDYIHKKVPELSDGNRGVIDYYNNHGIYSQTKGFKRKGHGWNVEQPIDQNGAQMLYDDATGDPLPAFCASFKLGQKFQVIDLFEEGFNEKLLGFKTKIHISDLYAAHANSGSSYHIWVTLLNSNYDVIDLYSFGHELSPTYEKEWFEVSHTFENHLNSARYIVYYHSGIDITNSAGFYGTKITKSTLKVLLG